ncbi:MAG: MBL fold metallo-hydrolase [Pseudomonadota bacterium]|nr:MBL fold metallo-hydrolase [Pseudomonadota bacterium]
MATLTFCGAAQQVTGSLYLIRTARHAVLLECGMTQGKEELRSGTEPDFPFEAAKIDAVIVSHAHLDHSGMLPLLVAKGFSGIVYLTRPSNDLLPIMLNDAASLHQRDVQWENRKRQRAGKRPVEPLYSRNDIERALGFCEGIDYGEKISVVHGIDLRFRDAGHILGSAIVELWFGDAGQRRKLVFSGDLGNNYAPLMKDPEILLEADVVLMESTYGSRNHRALEETLDEFKGVIEYAAKNKGNILIPAFAVGRTQDLIYRLGELYHEGRLDYQRVYIDSPMAIRVTDVYERHQSLFNHDDPAFRNMVRGGWDNWLPNLAYTSSTEESMALNRITGGAIIIAGSGMCTGGRIRHHLKHNLWRPTAHVVFVGYQARGTLGRALVDGAKMVRIFRDDIAVKAQIHTLGGLSAHAGQSQLIDWVSHFEKPRPRLYLVHGELREMLALQKALVDRLDWKAAIPEQGDVIEL